MGLVDYNSSSSDGEGQERQQTPKLKSKTKIFIEPLPNQKTSSAQLTNILKPTTKRPASSGLASLLPPPKRPASSCLASILPLPTRKSNSNPRQTPNQQRKQPTLDPLPIPPSLPDQIRPNSSSNNSHHNLNEPSSSASTLNLFGLPAKPAPPSRPAESPEPHIQSSSNAISSAPQVTEEIPPAPSLLDPYPGYWQRKDGTWVQRDPEEPLWKAFYAEHFAQKLLSNGPGQDHLPKDFFKDGPSSNLVEFNAKKEAQLAWESRPKILDPRVEARQEQQAASKPAKYISSRARGRHQLTSLLTDAQANRAELEDRISRGKFNRKAGGAKYGF